MKSEDNLIIELALFVNLFANCDTISSKYQDKEKAQTLTSKDLGSVSGSRLELPTFGL